MPPPTTLPHTPELRSSAYYNRQWSPNLHTDPTIQHNLSSSISNSLTATNLLSLPCTGRFFSNLEGIYVQASATTSNWLSLHPLLPYAAHLERLHNELWIKREMSRNGSLCRNRKWKLRKDDCTRKEKMGVFNEVDQARDRQRISYVLLQH